MPQLDTGFYITQLFWLTLFFTLTYWYISSYYLPSMIYLYKFNKKKLNQINNEIDNIKSKKDNVDSVYINGVTNYIVEVIDTLQESNKNSVNWMNKSVTDLQSHNLNDLNQEYINTLVNLDQMFLEWKSNNKEYWSKL
uniref:ATP synthase F0 subunit 8 n=1 Tax=Imasa heleensis TaxID=2772037 RepID=A0A893DDC9_9EUKA|nr:ATP synthase F0 subunit 8 [Imasa heleensis]QRR29750.1 ATP synthase F0 subunit 8 [Imasa heleensis]